MNEKQESNRNFLRSLYFYFVDNLIESHCACLGPGFVWYTLSSCRSFNLFDQTDDTWWTREDKYTITLHNMGFSRFHNFQLLMLRWCYSSMWMYVVVFGATQSIHPLMMVRPKLVRVLLAETKTHSGNRTRPPPSLINNWFISHTPNTHSLPLSIYRSWMRTSK